MQLLPLLTFLASAVTAIDAHQDSGNFTTGLLSSLRNAGLSGVAGAFESIANTPKGQAMVNELMGEMVTLFAPDNSAFAAAQSIVASNSTLLSAVLSYHVVSGRFSNASSFSTAPNHTIMRTFLNDTDFVRLEGNKSQVLVAESMNGMTVNILRQPMNVSVTNTISYGNLTIHTINAALVPPGIITGVAGQYGFGALLEAVQSTPLIEPIMSARGITLFAPTDSSLASALSQLGSQSLNVTAITTVLGNHVINGTTAYSTQLVGGDFTSASGSKFKVSQNTTGIFVTSGSSTAQVIQADIPIRNGVVHLIDRVLTNLDNNPMAASSAFGAATSSAASFTTSPGAIGPTSSSTAGSSGGNSQTGGALRKSLGTSASMFATIIVLVTLAAF